MKRVRLLLLTFALLVSSIAVADEGMWLLPLLQKYNMAKMKEMGLQLGADNIYSADGSSIKDAIVMFGRGCTGEVISYKGLVLTNHHCGYSSIQQHSSVEHDYLKDGFWAKTYEEEIPTPGLTVTFLRRFEDVTDQILPKLNDDMEEAMREQTANYLGDQIAKEAVKGTNLTGMVKSFYGNNRYYLVVYEVFKDIRMVGAPPSSIGKFGADTDNWQYPRHTGDFSLFRIYANKNNEAAEYSKDNVPYRPKRALRISLKGYSEGDFAFIMGYPGSTERYMTSYQVQQTMDVANTDLAYIRGVKQEVWKRFMEKDPAIRIKYSSKYARSANYWKNAIGQNEALKRLHVVADKRKEEMEFMNWVNATPERRAKYGNTMDMVRDAVDSLNEPLHLMRYYNEALIKGAEYNQVAMAYTDLLQVIEQKDTAMLSRYLRGTEERIKEGFFKDYDMDTDRATTKAMFRIFRENIPQSKQPDFFRYIDRKFKGDIDRFVDRLFDRSIFVSYDRLVDFLKDPSARKLKKDLGFMTALSIREALEELTPRYNHAETALEKGNRYFIAGCLEKLNGAASYPDANFTMRLTYGSVQGYSPRDAVSYSYYTTLDGVMEKEDPNNWEFIVPERLKQLYENKDFGQYAMPNGKMPLAFLTTNDITGGNSGSPVMDAEGNLIGTAFDGNWESLSGDIMFEKKLQRCINVDVRYTLFIIDKFAGCTRLIDEMELVK